MKARTCLWLSMYDECERLAHSTRSIRTPLTAHFSRFAHSFNICILLRNSHTALKFTSHAESHTILTFSSKPLTFLYYAKFAHYDIVAHCEKFTHYDKITIPLRRMPFVVRRTSYVVCDAVDCLKYTVQSLLYTVSL